MNELSRHIECLLLSHDCVVVPQFGGFVTMATNAMREETEQLFFPPIRVVRFNPDLMEDDGLLTTAIREQHHCTPTEAKRHIQRMVLDLRQQLLTDGQVDFGSIGMFSQDEDGRVSFSPCQAGVVTPQFFGLDAFLMPKLTAAQRSGHRRGSQFEALGHEGGSDSQHITIHISKRSLKNVVAAAAIILLCALFSSPLEEAIAPSNQASLLPSEPTTEVRQNVTTPAPEARQNITTPSPSMSVLGGSAVETVPPIESVAVSAPSSPVEAAAPSSPSSSASAPSAESRPAGNYCIVLASDVSKKNANRYVETLQKRGFANARVYNNGKMNRVIIDGFETEQEAIGKNTELHRTNREYASTWVMAL